MRIPHEIRDQLSAKFAVPFPHLDERQQRLLMGTEARLLGHGGTPALSLGRPKGSQKNNMRVPGALTWDVKAFSPRVNSLRGLPTSCVVGARAC
ncbi:hypothetical protein ACFRH6_21115 [Streptomyces sp. NPDC056749]|uniref:hypothetical protein n=1 Tax=Streptomyces sp. NPDC056749 TaxID=3345936 RepID=UPI0036C3AC8B